MFSQKEIFQNIEADNWFTRNKKNNNKNLEHGLSKINDFLKNGDKILEIGCSNASKLHKIELNTKFKLDYFGIDPSIKSIEDGTKKYKNFNLTVGTSDKLNFPDTFFDVLIVGFCLYVVDRNLIFKTVSEIDRVLKENGVLIITDFEPPFPIRKKYHHIDGIFTFKNNYSSFFTGGGHYSIINKIQYSHSEKKFSTNIDERISTTYLFKEKIEDIYKDI